MKKYFLFIIFIVLFWASIPWSYFWLQMLDEKLTDFKLWLDLHGGVELDYLVDFASIEDLTAERKAQIIEDMKTILDNRVRRVGTTEPTLNTASYGDETHIIVQVPTPNSYSKLDPVQRSQKETEFIAEAKWVIGQVIKIQFKEARTPEEYDVQMKKRSEISSTIQSSFSKNTLPFDAWGQKIADTNENVFFFKNGDIMNLLNLRELRLNDLTTLFAIDTLDLKWKTYTGKIPTITVNNTTSLWTKSVGSGFAQIESLDANILTPESPVTVKILFIDNEPLRYKPALWNNNQILDEKRLINTFANFDPSTNRHSVSLVFDTEWGTMFGDITERNIGKQIAIFLWNTLLTAPSVSSRIDGNAIITAGFEKDEKLWANNLSKKINEGIVPVGIYEHSERTIWPNLWKKSLMQLIMSWIIGLVLILIFLAYKYKIPWVWAGISLIVYLICFLWLIRLIWITLTLSWVAGIVLTIGVAIDGNILILERIKDFEKMGLDTRTSIKKWLAEAWSAIWDSNLTGILVWLLLWWLWVSMMKWFGQMTTIGIIMSILVIRYFTYPITTWLNKR